MKPTQTKRTPPKTTKKAKATTPADTEQTKAVKKSIQPGIVQVGTGRNAEYHVRATIKLGRKRRVERKAVCASQREAVGRLAEMKGELAKYRDGITNPKAPKFMEDLIASFRRAVAYDAIEDGQGKRIGGIRAMALMDGHLTVIGDFFRGTTVRELNTDDLERFKRSLAKPTERHYRHRGTGKLAPYRTKDGKPRKIERSAATIGTYFRTLRWLLGHGEKIGALTVSPFRRLPDHDPIRELMGRHHRQRILTQIEAGRLMAALRDTESLRHIYPIVAFLLLTGRRAGEAYGLKWGQVDLRAGVITINRRVTKTRKDPIERIAIGPHLTEILTNVARSSKAKGREDNVFTYAGHPVKRIGRGFSRALEIAQIADPLPRIHDLRHSAATWAFAGDVDSKTISERLGHTTISTTLDTYVKTSEKQQRKASDVLETTLLAGEEEARKEAEAAAKAEAQGAVN